MALFDVNIDATCGNARALTFETAHGTVHTPMFMPVGTHATVKGVTTPQLRELNSQVVLANTYHLYMRPGVDIIEKAGGVQKFMNYDGALVIRRRKRPWLRPRNCRGSGPSVAAPRIPAKTRRFSPSCRAACISPCALRT